MRIITAMIAVAALALMTPAARGQGAQAASFQPTNGLPATCQAGQVRFKSTVTAGFYKCNPANTWTLFGTGGGSVTSFTIAATANETAVSGTCTITTSGTCTTALAAAIDMTSKTYLKVPNSATPTVNAVGEIAEDTNFFATGRGCYLVYDGTAATCLVGALASDTPANGDSPVFNTGGTIDWQPRQPAFSGLTVNGIVTAASASTIQTICTGCTLNANGDLTLDAGAAYGPDIILIPTAGQGGASFDIDMIGGGYTGFYGDPDTNSSSFYNSAVGARIDFNTASAAFVPGPYNAGFQFVADGIYGFPGVSADGGSASITLSNVAAGGTGKNQTELQVEGRVDDSGMASKYFNPGVRWGAFNPAAAEPRHAMMEMGFEGHYADNGAITTWNFYWQNYTGQGPMYWLGITSAAPDTLFVPTGVSMRILDGLLRVGSVIYADGGIIATGNVTSVGTVFASLGTPTDGSMIYCSDCKPTTVVASVATNPVCTSAGNGALAVRLNGAWECQVFKP